MDTDRVAELLGRVAESLRSAADDLDACVVALTGPASPGALPGARSSARTLTCECGHPQLVHTRRRGAGGVVCAGFGCRCEVFMPAAEALGSAG